MATTVRIAYFFPAYWCLNQVLGWQNNAVRYAPEYLWPVAWLGQFHSTKAGVTLLGGAVVALLLGALLAHYRAARIVAFLALLEVLALKFSLGKIHHLMHAWLLTLFVWCWLPKGWVVPHTLSLRARHQGVRVFHAGQLLIAATYSLSGLGKVLGSGYQALQGQVTALHPSALARHVAARLLETNEQSLWGAWVIEWGPWLWPLMLATIVLQLFAWSLARRPAMHGALGAGLVAFHAMTALALGIDFTPAVVLVGVLFCCSPLQPVPPERTASADLH